jgi:hypothetical protein
MGSRGIAVLILNLGARRGSVVIITPRPLYPRKRPGTHCKEAQKKLVVEHITLSIAFDSLVMDGWMDGWMLYIYVCVCVCVT